MRPQSLSFFHPLKIKIKKVKVNNMIGESALSQRVNKKLYKKGIKSKSKPKKHDPPQTPGIPIDKINQQRKTITVLCTCL